MIVDVVINMHFFYYLSAMQSKTLDQDFEGIVPKKLALIDFIRNYALNTLANSIGISL